MRAVILQPRAQRRDIAMLAFVLALILSYIWVWQRSFPAASNVFSITLLGALLSGQIQRGESLHDVGFRLDTLPGALALLGPLAAIVIASAVLIGQALGSERLPPYSTAAWPIAKLVVFGSMQQYVLLAFFYRRFGQMLPARPLPVVATAVVFAVCHLPNPFLTTFTFFAGLLSAIIYERAPNLWASGVAHGLISYHLFYCLPPQITGGLRVGPGYW